MKAWVRLGVVFGPAVALLLGASTQSAAQEPLVPQQIDGAILLASDDLPGWDAAGEGHRTEHVGSDGSITQEWLVGPPLSRESFTLTVDAVVELSVEEASTRLVGERQGLPEDARLITAAAGLGDDGFAALFAFPFAQQNPTFAPGGRASAGLRFENMVLRLEFIGKDAAQPISDGQVLAVVRAAAAKARAFLRDPVLFDWDAAAPDAARPWLLTLGSEDVGPDWQVGVSDREAGADNEKGQPVILGASRSFSRPDGALIKSTVLVYASPEEAHQHTSSFNFMRGSGRGPSLTISDMGDEARGNIGVGPDKTDYRVKVRRGSILAEVQLYGPTSVFPTAADVLALARKSDAKLAGA